MDVLFSLCPDVESMCFSMTFLAWGPYIFWNTAGEYIISVENDAVWYLLNNISAFFALLSCFSFHILFYFGKELARCWSKCAEKAKIEWSWGICLNSPPCLWKTQGLFLSSYKHIGDNEEEVGAPKWKGSNSRPHSWLRRDRTPAPDS